MLISKKKIQISINSHFKNYFIKLSSHSTIPMAYDRQKLKGKKIKKYNLLEVLGSGSFGTVYKALDTKNDNIFAIKVLSKTQMKQIPKLKELVETQIQVLEKINNQNVIKFVDSFSSGDNVFIVTEYCNGGDLEQFCKKNGKLSQVDAVTYLKQILNGFKGLHEINTMHRDFKLANVLFHNHVCKIADLGFAKKLKDQALTTTQLGTDQTMAPQVHEGERYGWEADIWSIGVVFYQMLYGRVPFKGANDWEILKKIKTTKPKFDDVDVSSEAIDFLERCLVYDPKKRIQWKEIYHHRLLYKSDITLTKSNIRGTKYNPETYETYYAEHQEKRKTVKIAQELRQTLHQEKQLFENAGDIKNADSSAERAALKKQQAEEEMARYENMIIDKRNNIMLAVTFILPLEKQFSKIPITHSKPLYQICKQTYIEVKRLRQDVMVTGPFKSQFKDLPRWKQFKEKPIYNTLCNRLFEDELFAESLALSYRAQFGGDNNVNRQSNISNLRDAVTSYLRQLTPYLKKQDKKTKPSFIKMLKALKIIEENNERNFQRFTQQTKSMDIQKEEKEILNRI